MGLHYLFIDLGLFGWLLISFYIGRGWFNGFFNSFSIVGFLSLVKVLRSRILSVLCILCFKMSLSRIVLGMHSFRCSEVAFRRFL